MTPGLKWKHLSEGGRQGTVPCLTPVLGLPPVSPTLCRVVLTLYDRGFDDRHDRGQTGVKQGKTENRPLSHPPKLSEVS